MIVIKFMRGFIKGNSENRMNYFMSKVAVFHSTVKPNAVSAEGCPQNIRLAAPLRVKLLSINMK